jgi:uncharacterized membrane protein
MRHNLLSMSISAAMLAALTFPAEASPLCVKERQPFALASDTMTWTMSISPGENCIQGLRWSYMQIYEVSVVSGPSKGRILIVGSGFRYFAADSSEQTTDKFTLLISGKNRRDPGKSTLEIEVHSGAGESGSPSVKRLASLPAVAENLQ